MKDVFIFMVGGLATYRLALLFSKESGPGRLMQKLRKAPPARSSAREGLSCPLCLSVWFGAAITAYYWKLGLIAPAFSPIYALALSAVGVCLNQSFTKGEL